MFCSKCGTQNEDGAAFCKNCGNNLAVAGTSPSVPAVPGYPTGTPPPNSPSGKSQPIAAFLNLFFGIGYLYLGYKRVLGVPAIVFVILAIVLYIIIGTLSLGIGSLIIAILFAIDGWQKGGGAKGFISAE